MLIEVAIVIFGTKKPNNIIHGFDQQSLNNVFLFKYNIIRYIESITNSYFKLINLKIIGNIISDVDCYNTNNNGSSYNGTVHTSSLNHPCLNWQTVNSQLVPYHENHTYCRNQNGFGGPWCYIGTLNNGFENCNIPMCGMWF